MKIAIKFKGTMIEDYKIALEKRNFKIENCSDKKTLWVCDLKTIHTSYVGRLTLEKQDLKYYAIDLEDILYYEIHSE